MTSRQLLFATALALAPVPAAAQAGPVPNPAYVVTPAGDAIQQIAFERSRRLKKLHDIGLALRQSDGGMLTPTHRAELQAKLDRIEMKYRMELERVSPWSVDSRGMRRAALAH